MLGTRKVPTSTERYKLGDIKRKTKNKKLPKAIKSINAELVKDKSKFPILPDNIGRIRNWSNGLIIIKKRKCKKKNEKTKKQKEPSSENIIKVNLG